MSNKLLIPILIKVEGEERIVYKDVSSLSTESLIKLKKCFKGILFDTSLAINEIITNDVLRETQIRHLSTEKNEKKIEKRRVFLKKKKEEEYK